MPSREGVKVEGARDAFFHLLSFATLATWVIALGSLLFALINNRFVDPLSYQGDYRSLDISTQLASIIVALPVYLGVVWGLSRRMLLRPELRESGVRKWLTYIALFVTAVIAIADIITFLTFLLQGEITTRFVLKVISILVLSGGVLGYYLFTMRQDKEMMEK